MVLEQDQVFAKKLENLLYAMSFFPAKKENQDVRSYQDIEFSFQPDAISGIDQNAAAL